MNRFICAAVCAVLLSAPALADGPRPLPPQNGTAVYPGTQTFTAPRVQAKASSQPSDVTLNFPNADVHEVAKSILGDILGLNYAVDPSATGSVTVVTAEPVSRVDVLPILEESLSAAHLGLIRKGSVYTIIPIEKAKRQPQLLGAADPGFGSESIHLNYVNAVELKKLLDPLVPENAISQADAGRNLMLINGTADQRNAIRGLIKQFDVNWLRGMSFALLVPERTDVHMLMPELDSIVNTQGSPTAGLVRLVMIERLNGILAISTQPQYLADLKKWMTVLDRAGGENERKLFVYHVQNGRAADLATVLINAFGGGGASGATPRPTAPNLTATGQPSQIASATSGFQGNTQQTGSAGFGGSGFSGSSSGIGSGTSLGGSSGSGTSTFGSQSSTANGSTSSQPQNVAQTLQIAEGGTPISVSSDENNNAIVVYSTPRQYAVISAALAQLDVQPLQVLIEAAITEVTLTKELQFGIQWLLNSGSSHLGFSEGSSSAPTAIYPGFSYLLASGNQITATLNALQSLTTVKVVSAPKLLVLNNHTATLSVGDQVPISTGSLTTATSADPAIATEISYLPTGVILTVTPRVNDSGLVLLDIAQEVSDVAKNVTTPGLNSPTITDRKFTSSVAVKDGETVALGGLILDSANKGRDGIPFFSQIPVVGALFGSTDNKDNRTELLVLLTPRVVRNPVDAKSITQELKEKIGTLAPPPPPPKDFFK